MDVSARLNILLENNVITEGLYKNINKVISQLKAKFNIEITEENGGMFITHLSMALARREKDEIVNRIDKTIFEEIKNDLNYQKAVEIVNDIKEIVGNLPVEETEFIEMHICTLLNK